MQALPTAAANSLQPAQAGRTAVSRCADCCHRLDDRQAIEQRVAGLAVFGSAYGASIGASRLCVLHDRLVSPDDRYARFVPVALQAAPIRQD
jgi:hypothetical protein